MVPKLKSIQASHWNNAAKPSHWYHMCHFGQQATAKLVMQKSEVHEQERTQAVTLRFDQISVIFASLTEPFAYCILKLHVCLLLCRQSPEIPKIFEFTDILEELVSKSRRKVQCKQICSQSQTTHQWCDPTVSSCDAGFLPENWPKPTCRKTLPHLYRLNGLLNSLLNRSNHSKSALRPVALVAASTSLIVPPVARATQKTSSLTFRAELRAVCRWSCMTCSEFRKW